MRKGFILLGSDVQTSTFKKAHNFEEALQVTDYCPRTDALLVYKKGNVEPVQRIPFEAPYTGFEKVMVADFNEDGAFDFALDTCYNGFQNQWVYFLYNRTKNCYFQSRVLQGEIYFNSLNKHFVKLAKEDLVNSKAVLEYKLADDKLVLVKRNCYSWAKKKNNWIEVQIPCK